MAATQVKYAADYREGVSAHQHPVVVESEASGCGIQELADVPGGGFQRLLEIGDPDLLQRIEFGPAGQNGACVTQQPVQGEGKSFFLPPVQVSPRNAAGLRPMSAFLG